MQSSENKRPSSGKRPGASLTVDTGSYKNKAKAPSPPRTPITSSTRIGKGSATAASWALRVRTGPRETFLEDITPVDTGRHHTSDGMAVGRDSHDLSLLPQQVTRDSLVDHMLLSFDQLSYGQDGGAFGASAPTQDESNLYNAFGDEEIYPSYTANHNNRAVGHGHSYSSDYESQQNTRPSSQATRGRRSNSSSNFQTGLGRLNSIRNEPNGTTGAASRPPQTQSRVLHSRSGKGSKGSSANSLDLGYVQITSTHRWGHGIGGRSSSFDFGQDRQMLNRQISPVAAPYSPYDYDAAPTPTVPVGPRRDLAMAYSPPLPETMPAPPIPKTIERKRSTRSSKSAYKAPNNGINGLGISLHQGTNEKVRELPPLPAFVKETAAPAPSIGYGKSKDPPAPASKPGFFRRVFGSSKRNEVPAPQLASAHGSLASLENVSRPNSKPQHISSMLNSQPPSREAPPPPPKEQPHVITKRPSSFFRRRKKSISEPEAPPPLPPAPLPPQPFSNREDLISPPLPSPVSSLRQVMNSYLERTLQDPNGLLENGDSHYDKELELDEQDVKGFSPSYNPDANATIRTINPTSQESGEEKAPALRVEGAKDYLEIDISGSRLSAGSPSRDHPDGTFLHDSSDNDPDGRSSISHISKEISDKRVPSPIPPESVARDMALVAEYERVHSKRSKTAAPAALSASQNSLVSAAGSQSSKPKAKDEDRIMITSTKSISDKQDRAWLASSNSEEDLNPTPELVLPLEGAKQSTRTSESTGLEYMSAKSVTGEANEEEEEEPNSPAALSTTEVVKSLDEPPLVTVDGSEPTDGDRERAKKIYDGNEDFIQKAKAAAWMGEDGEVRRRTLLAYMELYDFANLNILAAMRLVCGRLILKGESQQVDRILDAFAKRWCQCNPNHGFKATDVVHTICYSVLLLNTDLHMADIECKMTRSQFVKNTMPTILRVVADAAPGAFESRPTILPSKWDESSMLSPVFLPIRSQSSEDLQPAVGSEKPSWRSSLKPPMRTNSDERSPTPLSYGGSTEDCGPLVKAPFHGTIRTWETLVEIVLKDFYGSIRADRLPLFGAADEKQPTQSQGTLSVITHGMLRRSPSVLSKATSEAVSINRGRTAEAVRPATGRWQSKNRSRPRFYPGSAMGSSRTSLDDQSSMWSPSVSSSTWSKYSLGKTQTSMSVDSFGSNWQQGDYQSSIGFANALSQAIIREEAVASRASTGSEELRVAPLLEDESLGLAGAPWAKEGLVNHKHHLEAADKRAKDRNWNEVFAVIEKGYMTLFSFSSKSMRNKSKSKATGGVVGGGNWQDNAENLGSFLLRQTIASALPPPGYSKTRPHVWALSLPKGAVHLFQVGTPEIVKEFVSTANYWSARLSNHPLVGGISNIEYGWSDAIVNNALVQTINDGRPSTSGPRPSIQSSLRSSLDQGPGSFRSKLPGDKVIITDWTPPTQSMRSSNLMAQDQLRTLIAYVQGIEDELQKHNQLRSSMLLAFTPRHYNAQKAMANWEKKSSYLLREIVKFRTYIDSLQAAETQKQKIYAEREAEKAVREGENEDDDDDEGDTTLRPE